MSQKEKSLAALLPPDEAIIYEQEKADELPARHQFLDGRPLFRFKEFLTIASVSEHVSEAVRRTGGGVCSFVFVARRGLARGWSRSGWMEG